MERNREQTLGVLLAGGRSQRMGGVDKSLARLGGRPLIARVLERMRPQVASLVINANGDPGRFEAFGLDVVPDTSNASLGPLAGILTGMLWARTHRTDIRFIATAPTDAPFLPLDLVSRLSAGLEDCDVAIARCRGQDHPVFGLFAVDLVDQLGEFLHQSPNRAVKAWLDGQAVVHVNFTPAEEDAIDPFFNLNTPSDLATAERVVAESDARTPIG